MAQVTIGVNKETKERLKTYGRFYETYDDVLNRFMNEGKLRPYKINVKR
jgi:hypothetical protein